VKKIICVFFILGSLFSLQAESFRHKFTKGEKYRIVTEVNEKVLVNDELVNQVNYLNKIAAEVMGVANGSGQVSALYQISGRAVNDRSSFVLQEESQSSFSIDPQGRYRIGPIYFHPSVRDVPLFPESSLDPQASWTAPGEEVFDLRDPFGIRTPIQIPINPKYVFLGVEESDGKRLAQIKIEYEYRHDVKESPSREGGAFPVKISGAHSMIYYWDIEAGKTDSYKEEFYALFNLSNGNWIEFMGNAQGKVIVAKPLNKKETVEDINRDIEKGNIEGARAESADDGVKITLDNIQFPPDSAEITAAEFRKIEKIAAILKKYSDRDIRITGHTAAVGTPESCLELSIQRAKAVGDALLHLDARRAEQMTIEGKGLSQPVAPNNTEAGRVKNRRVEITILEN
jgi:outer membrane protein OmpA-like peptidoglycan-associated protein